MNDTLEIPAGCPLSEKERCSRMVDAARRSKEFRLEDGTVYQCPSLCDNTEIGECPAAIRAFKRETRISLTELLKILKPER